ncbi:hypothetical protein BCY91_13995 [Pelobium manganitolerans]|uniref:Uncharacterized protein n=1 Tax=Pelobium manganitolerans TaxID=1842495 RepID=A0A419SAA3_9SPHI|nr:hypothetical protein [Pelobium manganitolerans]RKD18984.1 hypothetical protein BCY91_13995 [Pelobium manganitolerans]
MLSETILYFNQTIEVDYLYEKAEAGDMSTPPSGEVVEIDKIVIDGQDCSNALYIGNLSEIIEKEIFKKRKEREDAWENW